jgi:hypothetical protein
MSERTEKKSLPAIPVDVLDQLLADPTLVKSMQERFTSFTVLEL